MNSFGDVLGLGGFVASDKQKQQAITTHGAVVVYGLQVLQRARVDRISVRVHAQPLGDSVTTHIDPTGTPILLPPLVRPSL